MGIKTDASVLLPFKQKGVNQQPVKHIRSQNDLGEDHGKIQKLYKS
jgi:hypothetical protein